MVVDRVGTGSEEGRSGGTADGSLVARTLHGIFDAMRRGGVPSRARQQQFIIVAGQRPEDLAAIVDSYVARARSSAPAGRIPVGVIDSMAIVKANPIVAGTDRPGFYNFRESHREVQEGVTELAFIRGYEEAADHSTALKGQELSPGAAFALSNTASLGCQMSVYAVHVCDRFSRSRILSVDLLGEPEWNVTLFREGDVEPGKVFPGEWYADSHWIDLLRKIGGDDGELAFHDDRNGAWHRMPDAAELVRGLETSGLQREGVVRDGRGCGDGRRLHAHIVHVAP